jgi:hypothetical protein
MSDDQVDGVLAEAGRRWRESQSAPPDPGVDRFAHGEARARWVPVATVAGVAVVLVAVLVPLAVRYGADGGPAAGASDPGPPTLPLDTGRGLPVQGMGTLLRDRDGPLRLCARVVATMDLPPSQAACGRVAVPVTGVDPSWLVNTTTGGQAYSRPVRVEGTYHSGTLAVSRVVEATIDDPQMTEPPVPCTPPRGWRPGAGFSSTDDAVSAEQALAQEVASDPDRYNELWEGHPDDTSVPQVKVLVVGTTGDVGEAGARLGAIYRGNLCVHKVRYSASDLRRIVDRLNTDPSTPMEASLDPILNKVRVKVVALDPPTVAILDEMGRDALSLEEPMLQWLE